MRTWYKMLKWAGDAKAASHGPTPYIKRRTRANAHRLLARALRRL
jgi:hypothetical protein